MATSRWITLAAAACATQQSHSAAAATCGNEGSEQCQSSNVSMGMAPSLDLLRPEQTPRVNDAFMALASPERRVERLLGMVSALRGLSLGFDVDLEEHAVQTATRAYWDGEDDEVVVASLLHDVGELMVPESHGDVAAAVLRPYISPRTEWLLRHHEIFQFYHYAGAYMVEDPGGPRSRYESSPYFRFAAYWCLAYDQTAFDPTYSSFDLRSFAPLLRRVLGRPPFWHPEQAAHATNSGKLAIVAAYPTSDAANDSPAASSTLHPRALASSPVSHVHDLPAAGAPWNATFTPQILAYDVLTRGGEEGAQAVMSLLEAVLTDGLAVVEGLPTNSDSAGILVRHALLPKQYPIIDQPFWDAGEANKVGAYSFNFTNMNDPAGHKGYLLDDLPPHTDGAYLWKSPRLKVLHCHAHQGELPLSTFADGYRAVQELEGRHRAALLREPVATVLMNGTEPRGMEVGGENVIGARRHVLTYDGDGRLSVMWNPHDRLRDEASAELNAALDRLGERLTSADNLFRVALRPGSALVADNWRVLHGRAQMRENTRRSVSGADLPDWSLRAKWREVASVVELHNNYAGI